MLLTIEGKRQRLLLTGSMITAQWADQPGQTTIKMSPVYMRMCTLARDSQLKDRLAPCLETRSSTVAKNRAMLCFIVFTLLTLKFALASPLWKQA